MFLTRTKYQTDDGARSDYVKEIIKKVSLAQYNKSSSANWKPTADSKVQESDLVFNDPTLISLALIEENILYNFDLDSGGEKIMAQIEELSEVYYSKSFKSYKHKEPSKIKTMYTRFTPYYKFLNDLALGNYAILSETKNLFSENYELNNF